MNLRTATYPRYACPLDWIDDLQNAILLVCARLDPLADDSVCCSLHASSVSLVCRNGGLGSIHSGWLWPQVWAI